MVYNHWIILGEKIMPKLVALLSIIMVFTGCSINHPIDEDYSQYLANNAGEFQLPGTEKVAEYTLTPKTKAHHYEFRAAITGYANLWIVEFGDILVSTLESPDVQAAFRSLSEATGEVPENTLLLEFNLVDYTFKDFEARVKLQINARKDGKLIIDETYFETGVSQGGKMFWGGVFGMKNAIQQSTKNAIDKILFRAITDINEAS